MKIFNLAMAYPGQGIEKLYRNNIEHVASYLNSRHEEKYMVINLSERKYDTLNFNGRVVEAGWPDHQAPPFMTLIEVLKCIDSWLKIDQENVIVVHCLAGRGRTGTIICCYMLYAGIFQDMDACAKHYAEKRSSTGQGVTQPSQLRYMYYVDKILNHGLRLESKSINVTSISLHYTPLFSDQSFTPVIHFYRYTKNSEEFLFSTSNSKVPVSYNQRKVNLPITIKNTGKIKGDILIKIFNLTKGLLSRKLETIARIIFHTGLIEPGCNTLTFFKKDMDIARKDSRLNQKFSLKLTFDVHYEEEDFEIKIFDSWLSQAHIKKKDTSLDEDIVINESNIEIKDNEMIIDNNATIKEGNIITTTASVVDVFGIPSLVNNIENLNLIEDKKDIKKSDNDVIKTTVIRDESKDGKEIITQEKLDDEVIRDELKDAKETITQEKLDDRVKNEDEIENNSLPLKEIAHKVLKELIEIDNHKLFYEPVKEDDPNYFMIISQPMDFSTMTNKLNDDKYQYLSQVQEDFELICKNALLYYYPGSIYHEEAQRLLNEGKNIFKTQSQYLKPEFLEPPK